jgi:phosphoketolase
LAAEAPNPAERISNTTLESSFASGLLNKYCAVDKKGRRGSSPPVGPCPRGGELAAMVLLREGFPKRDKDRFVDVVDLSKRQPSKNYLYRITDADFDSLLPSRNPLFSIFMAVLPFCSIGLRPAYSDRFDVHDYKEKGNINSPMEPATNDEIDPFSLTIDAIARIPDCRNSRPMPRRSPQ